jgi:hypothetical protein
MTDLKFSSHPISKGDLQITLDTLRYYHMVYQEWVQQAPTPPIRSTTPTTLDFQTWLMQRIHSLTSDLSSSHIPPGPIPGSRFPDPEPDPASNRTPYFAFEPTPIPPVEPSTTRTFNELPREGCFTEYCYQGLTSFRNFLKLVAPKNLVLYCNPTDLSRVYSDQSTWDDITRIQLTLHPENNVYFYKQGSIGIIQHQPTAEDRRLVSQTHLVASYRCKPGYILIPNP